MSETQAETRRVVLKVGERRFDRWTRVEIVRDLGEIAGSFTLELHDAARADAALPLPGDREPSEETPLSPGQAVTLEVDDEPLLVGWIDEVSLDLSGQSLSAQISGRDKTGDLVDCAAAPTGPAEFRNLTLTQIAERICQPFGIPVRAEVDVGAPFPRFSLDVCDTALAAIEKAARQRAVLVVSDGVGGLVLTRAGDRRGPAPVTLPGSSQAARATLSWRDRFSIYIVKGQSERAGGNRRAAAPLDGTAEPLTPDPPPVRPAPTVERAGVVMTGRATDPGVTRYRPFVALAPTQSGGASVQRQAEWRATTARGKSEELEHTVVDWRAGDEQKLWRPNELVLVVDRYAGISGDMLVKGVRYAFGQEGYLAALTLVRPEAFELIEEGAERDSSGDRRRGRSRPSGGDGRAESIPGAA